MKFSIEENGQYITVTTRRSNFTDLIFGKFSFWPSKQAYLDGDCHNVATGHNVYLGTSGDNLKEAAHNFVKKTKGGGK